MKLVQMQGAKITETTYQLNQLKIATLTSNPNCTEYALHEAAHAIVKTYKIKSNAREQKRASEFEL